MIKQPFLLVVSAFALVLAGGLFLWRFEFWLGSEVTEARVERIEAHDGRCGNKSKYNCTRFEAIVSFEVAGKTYQTDIGAGSSRGHGQPTTRATRHPGQRLDVLYDPAHPSDACVDHPMEIWGAPIMAMVVQLITFFGSFFEGNRRRW